MENDAIKKFLEALRSQNFRKKLPSGLKAYERTGEVVQIIK